MLAAPGEPAREAVIESETDTELASSETEVVSSASAESEMTEQESADDGGAKESELGEEASYDSAVENVDDSLENATTITATDPELPVKEEPAFFSSKPVAQDNAQEKEQSAVK